MPSQPDSSAQQAAQYTVPVSASWQRTFALIEKAGGPSKWSAFLIPELTAAERREAFFNFLAFMVGPFAYLGYGMWKKAVSLTLVGGVVAAGTHSLLDAKLPGVSMFVIPALFGSRANADYYKKIVLQDDGWW